MIYGPFFRKDDGFGRLLAALLVIGLILSIWKIIDIIIWLWHHLHISVTT